MGASAGSLEVGERALVLAAQAGDAASLGLLLEQHRADMRAVAISVLGYSAAADDAVQDAMVTALSSLSALRNPDAVGAWLRTIVRNTCRMQLRRSHPQVPLDFDVVAPESVEEILERQALRDWPWQAIGELSEPLQLVLVLRHFGTPRSYAEIAAICGVPVGTVRSRLNQARRHLAATLRAQGEAAVQDSGALGRERGAQLRTLLLAAERGGGLPGAVADISHPGLVLTGWWGSVPRGRDLLVHILRCDSEAGVRERVGEVVASRRFTIVESELISPSWDPTHCPPSVLWVMTMREGRIQRIGLHHPVPA